MKENRQFVRVWAAELAPRGIRVNTVVPGPTDTPALRGLAADDASTAALLKQLAGSTTMSRLADSDEIAAAVLFLASAESSFMTGSELFADGGEVQTYPIPVISSGHLVAQAAQFRVRAVGCEQVGGTAVLGDRATVDDDDPVGITQGAQRRTTVMALRPLMSRRRSSVIISSDSASSAAVGSSRMSSGCC